MAYALALRLTGNAAEAEDLAEDALVKAVRGLPGFRGDCDAGIWLYRIVMNTWKNRLRSPRLAFWRRLRGLSSGAGEVPETDPPDPAPGPEAEAEASARRALFAGAVAALEPEDRALLVLRELDGRSYAEIAQALSVPVGTVRSRLSRAREKLRSLLARALEEK